MLVQPPHHGAPPGRRFRRLWPAAVVPWLRAHPAIAFVGLTLAWSWSVWSLLIVVVGRGGLLRNPPGIAYGIAAVGGMGPSLAGLTLIALLDGRPGLAALRARCRPPAAGRWWLALLLIPAVTALTPLLRGWAGEPVDVGAMRALLVPGLALGLAAGLMEEFGWRGFLLPRLRLSYPTLKASLYVGFVWGGLWHGYADYFGVPGAGWVFWLLILLLGPVLLTAWSMVLAVVFEHTQGNLLLAVLMHASISSSALVFGQAYASPLSQLGWTAFAAAMAWCAAAGLWWTTRVPTSTPSPARPCCSG